MKTFADYMERVLYGPAGYYSSGTAKSGKVGDYFTAPDVGSVFGQLLAEIFRGWKERLKLDPFSLIEVGAGEGRLAQDILKAHSFSYVAVERSEARCARLKEFEPIHAGFDVHRSAEELPSQSLQGILFGNELIDAFPVHRVRQKRGKFEELFVVEDPSASRLRFVWAEPSTPKLAAYFSRLDIELPDDYETEVNLAMTDWLCEMGRFFKKGLVVLIDYGRPAYDYYSPERTRGTLRSFSKHRVSADFLDPRGMVDLTADVDFTSLALDSKAAGFAPLAFMEMGTFLMSAMSAGFEPAAKDMRAVRYLLHPEGMGAAFHVLILGKDLDPSAWVFEHNRIARLGS